MIGATIVRYILLTTMFVAGLQIGLELIASGQNNEEFRLMTAVQHFGQILVVFLAFDTWKMALNWLMPLAIDPKVTIASTTKQPTKAPPTPKEHGRPDGGWWYPDEIILTPHGPRLPPGSGNMGGGTSSDPESTSSSRRSSRSTRS